MTCHGIEPEAVHTQLPVPQLKVSCLCVRTCRQFTLRPVQVPWTTMVNRAARCLRVAGPPHATVDSVSCHACHGSLGEQGGGVGCGVSLLCHSLTWIGATRSHPTTGLYWARGHHTQGDHARQATAHSTRLPHARTVHAKPATACLLAAASICTPPCTCFSTLALTSPSDARVPRRTRAQSVARQLVGWLGYGCCTAGGLAAGMLLGWVDAYCRWLASALFAVSN